MTEGKGTYSLISVDVAPDEEVVRVDAKGVHREGEAHAAAELSQHDGASCGGDAQEADAGHVAPMVNDASNRNAGSDSGASASRATGESDSYDGRDDLEGPVPMAGMQRIIIAAVVVCLIAFIVYFAVSHG